MKYEEKKRKNQKFNVSKESERKMNQNESYIWSFPTIKQEVPSYNPCYLSWPLTTEKKN